MVGQFSMSGYLLDTLQTPYLYLFYLFIYSGCEPSIPGNANSITVLAKNLLREDNEGNFSLEVGGKPQILNLKKTHAIR